MGTRRITRRAPARSREPAWTPHPEGDIHPRGAVYTDGQLARSRNDAIRGALRTLIRRGHHPLVCESSLECFRCGAGASVAPIEGGGWRCVGNETPDPSDNLLTAPGCAKDRK